MYIRSLEMRNWKGYDGAKFEFPKPGKRKNVVLIGANNGFGKTSLLEALILCLYGAEGISYLPRSGGGERSNSYNEFLRRALHVPSKDLGQMQATVKVVFEPTRDDEEERIGIQRTWHFAGNGQHQPGNEEIQVWSGQDDEPVRVPGKEDRESYYRSFIAQRVLPAPLAQFFFFDGEQVQQLARQSTSAQVRQGIEGLLGINVMYKLQEDLKQYAAGIRSTCRSTDEGKLTQLRVDVTQLEAQVRQLHEELGVLRPRDQEIRDRFSKKLDEFTRLAGGTDALNELQEKRARYERTRDQDLERLRALARGDLALALVGAPLRKVLSEQLRGELARLRWENAKAEGERHGRLDKLMAGLEQEDQSLAQPLTEEQWAVLKHRLRRTWESLWYPPPGDCAATIRHAFLADDRQVSIRRLQQLDELGLGELEELLGSIDELDRLIRRATTDIVQISGTREEVDRLKQEIDQLRNEEKGMHRRISELENALRAAESSLADRKAEMGRMEKLHGESRPQLLRVEAAERITTLISDIIPACYKRYGERLNAALNEAYKNMAHKATVAKIEVNESAEVRLLNGRGLDLRSLDASAGEDQIFSLSLIAALAHISGRDIPVIMDTPLARLDSKHRENVLSYFTDRAGEQVILLSQPEEVNKHYYEQIAGRVCCKYLLDQQALPGGMGINRVQRDRYFF